MADRLTQSAWIKHGFDVLRYEGHEKLKADTMAKALNVSRGSFYWHFPSLSDFHDALLEAWQTENTLDTIAQLDALPDARTKIATLIQMGIDTPQPLENGMRRWGGMNEAVRIALEHVDQIRVRYLKDLLTNEGLPEHIAQDRAVLLSWAAIGRAFAPGFVGQTSAMAGHTLSQIFLTIPDKDETDENHSPDP